MIGIYNIIYKHTHTRISHITVRIDPEFCILFFLSQYSNVDFCFRDSNSVMFTPTTTINSVIHENFIIIFFWCLSIHSNFAVNDMGNISSLHYYDTVVVVVFLIHFKFIMGNSFSNSQLTFFSTNNSESSSYPTTTTTTTTCESRKNDPFSTRRKIQFIPFHSIEFNLNNSLSKCRYIIHTHTHIYTGLINLLYVHVCVCVCLCIFEGYTIHMTCHNNKIFHHHSFIIQFSILV